MKIELKIKQLILPVLLLIVVLVGIFLLNKFLFKSKQENMIYLSNGRLYLFSNDEKLGRGQIKDIIFNENNPLTFLYKNENDLYLYNKVSKKILENARNYIFAEDSILIQDINNALYLYKKDNLNKIDDNINQILSANSKNIFYIKGNKIIKYDKKAEEAINKTIQKYNVYDDNVIYMTLDNNIKKYNMSKEIDDTITESGLNYYSKNGNNLYYITSSNKLFLYKDGKSYEITANCNSVIDFDEEKNFVLYTKSDSKTYLYYNNDEIILFDQPILINKILFINDNIYVQDSNGNIYEIKNENKEIIDDNAFSNFLEYNNSLLYIKYNKEKNYNELYGYKNNKKILIKEGVKSQSIVIDSENKIIYYLDDDNNLYLYKNKEKQIDSNIYKYYLLDNKKVYYIKDYISSKAYGDLYSYNRKSKLVKNKVADITYLKDIIEN